LRVFAVGKQIELIKYHTFSFSNFTPVRRMLFQPTLGRSEFPEENPAIDDIKQYYSIGENLETNCTSNSSIPPAKLEWWINDMPIYDSEYIIKYSTVVDPATNRETSILGLRLPLTNEHFYRGRVKVSKSTKHFFSPKLDKMNLGEKKLFSSSTSLPLHKNEYRNVFLSELRTEGILKCCLVIKGSEKLIESRLDADKQFVIELR